MPFCMVAMLAFFSCSQDTYEKGEGEYSLMQAEMVEAHANGQKQIDYALTDEGVRLDFSEPLGRSWVEKTDTIYRVLLYYNKVSGSAAVKVVACNLVGVPSIVPADSMRQGVKTDPVRLESVWMGKNRRYLNTAVYLKIGNTSDAEAKHKIGVVADTTLTYPDGKNTLCMRLYHDQGGVPDYYSQRTFFSVAMQKVQADSVRMTINTDNGLVTKTFSLK